MQINFSENELIILGVATVCLTIIFMGVFMTVYMSRFIRKNVTGITYEERIRQLQTNIDEKINEMKEEMGCSFEDIKNDDEMSYAENNEKSIKIQKVEENIFEDIINEYLT